MLQIRRRNAPDARRWLSWCVLMETTGAGGAQTTTNHCIVSVSQFVSQFVSHFRLHPFALAVNLQDAPDTSAKVIRARTRSSFP